MAEELKSNDEALDKFIADDKPEAPVEESSEVETPEPSEEVTPKEPQEPEVETPDQETLRLFNEVRDRDGKTRVDNLMGAWQKDRTELLKLRGQGTSQPTTEDGKDDALVEYLGSKLEARQAAKEQAVQEAVKQEIEGVRTIYPQYSEKRLLETANDLSTGTKPASLMTAAIHLSKIDEAVKTRGDLTAEEIARKKGAGTIAGRSAVQTQAGVRPFDPAKDSGKTLDELIDDAKGEIGI